MSYLEQLKKLNAPTIGSTISTKSHSDTFDTSDKRHISINKGTSDTFDTTNKRHIPKIQFLADSQIKRNQARCSNCIYLNPCPSARNIKGECPSGYKIRVVFS